MRRFLIGIYAGALFLLVVSIVSIPQDGWRLMSIGETLALGFSVLVGFSGILLSYYAYVDGKILTALQMESKPEGKQEPKDLHGIHGIAFTMAHVKVDQLDRLQLGELKSRSGGNKKGMVKDIVSEARALTKHEYLETTSGGDVSVEILEDLAKKLGSDFEVSQGSASGKGSVLYIKRSDSSL
jgi:hypothetical protein